jgi:catechol 2,3-dioxygenase-like lactoylglutathione lyase family enzyme
MQAPRHPIDHITLAVEDLWESVRWYTQCLGFSEIESDRRVIEGETTGMISAVVQKDGLIVVLQQGTHPNSHLCKYISQNGPGVHHVAFSVPSLEGALTQVAQGGGAADIDVVQGKSLKQVLLRRDKGSAVRVELVEMAEGGAFDNDSITNWFVQFEKKGLV